MPKEKAIILVVDADPRTRKMLEIVLDPNDFALEECPTGREANRVAAALNPAMVLLDLDLPDMQGNDVIASLRTWSQVPIIVITARVSSEDAVTAFSTGADDYVLKPFNVSVLEARITASLRKSAGRMKGEPEIFNGPLRMDLVRHQVYLAGKLVTFTPKEYDLLRYLLVHCGKMLTHQQLLSEIWGNTRNGDVRYLRVFICRIREKMEAVVFLPPLITTQIGIGYRMEAQEPPQGA